MIDNNFDNDGFLKEFSIELGDTLKKLKKEFIH